MLRPVCRIVDREFGARLHADALADKMHRRFIITRKSDFITAAELARGGSEETFAPVLRFRSISELTNHFSSIGASAEALPVVQETVASHGVATLELPVRL